MPKIFVTGCHSPVNRMKALIQKEQVPTDQVHMLGEICSPAGQTAWLDALEYREHLPVDSLPNGQGYFVPRDDMLDLLQAILPRIQGVKLAVEQIRDVGITKKLLKAYAAEHSITVYVCDENPEGQYEIPGMGDALGTPQDGGSVNEAERRAAASRRAG